MEFFGNFNFKKIPKMFMIGGDIDGGSWSRLKSRWRHWKST